jgi:DNA polymerase-3 subunit delta'
VVLILLATGTERQLPTILSRCQVIRFRPLAAEDLRAILADHDVTDAATVEKLVRLAAGSAGRALALNDPELWGFRQVLISALGSPRPDPVGLATKVEKFVEDAGKESAQKRDRAGLVIRLITDILQTALRRALGEAETGDDPVEADRLRPLSARDPEALADMLEACTEADRYVERRVSLGLLIEQLAEKVCATR